MLVLVMVPNGYSSKPTRMQGFFCLLPEGKEELNLLVLVVLVLVFVGIISFFFH